MTMKLLFFNQAFGISNMEDYSKFMKPYRNNSCVQNALIEVIQVEGDWAYFLLQELEPALNAHFTEPDPSSLDLGNLRFNSVA